MSRRALPLALVGGLALAQGSGAPPDEARSAWGLRRAVRLQAGAQRPFAALDLPPEAAARAQPDLRDLRVVGPDGVETPYVLDRQERRETRERWSGVPSDTQQERRQYSSWTVDLGAPRRFERIDVEIEGQDFAKRTRVEASDDGQAWHTLREEAGLFERAWGAARVRHTHVSLDAPVEARHLRLTLDDRRSAPVRVTGLSVEALRAGEESRWTRPATLQRLGSQDGWSRYRVEMAAPFACEAVELGAQDPGFSRAVRLGEARQENGHRSERVLGEATLYRLVLDDAQLRGESLRLDVEPRQGGELFLEVQDGDSPPLRDPRLTLSGTAVRLIFPATEGPLWLYYANPATRAPLYDLAALQARLRADGGTSSATLGDEAPNPRFAKAVPLAFAAGAGAPLEATRWRFVRPFALAEREDLYTFTLESSDLQRLRPDLHDLRIVDAQDQQVPYILQPDVAEARVTLRLEPDPTPPARETPGRTSRYLLRPQPTGTLHAGPLPLTALELSVQPGFFSRPARLLVPREGGGRGPREAVLLETTLTRRSDAQGTLSLPLDGTPRSELRLEIDEGDDQALVLSEAVGVVRVPRVAFKARPGSYRLLLGNDEAAAPRYDLAALAREVLSWSAVPVQLGAAADNPAYRRRAGDYFKSAPPTLVLWGTLLAAVLALVYLTARVLGRGLPPTPDA